MESRMEKAFQPSQVCSEHRCPEGSQNATRVPPNRREKNEELPTSCRDNYSNKTGQVMGEGESKKGRRGERGQLE
jgi:hypothetical protein